MEKEKAIEYLNDVRNGIHIPAPGIELPLLNDKEKEAIDLAISALEKQEADRWIPVTERLPKEDCECRVTEGDFKYVFDCHWNNHKKQFEVWSHYQDGYLPITNVTAWKLKEAPYTEEKHEQN